MTAYTSASSGNWSAGSTWDGGLAPPSGAGHTVTIDNGNVVTVDVNWDIGSSPPTAGTAAITVTGTTGKLIIGAGVTLVARGDLTFNDAPFTMQAGSVLEFNASAATDAANQHYRLNLGNAGANANVIVTISGTSGAHCTIRSNVSTGGGTGSIVGGAAKRYHATITYCDFTNLGTATISGVSTGTGGTFDLANCLFDTCGKIEFFVEGATTITRLLNCTMKNTVASTCLNQGGGSTSALTSGTRLISGCVFDKHCTNLWRDYTITNTLFSGTVPLAGQGANPWASVTNNLLVWSTTSDASLMGSLADCYCFANHTTGNAHFLTALTGTGSLTVSGCVFESLATDSSGDCFSVALSTVASTIYTVEHNLTIPNAGGKMPGTMFSALGNANVTVVARHNTAFVGNAPAMVVGETYAGHAGLLASCRDNLFWDTSARSYKLRDLQSTVNDLITAANAHHNAGYNVLAGSNLKGYDNLDFTSGSPGANDVDAVNPDFVDATRNIAKWDLSLGGAGTAANALVELKKRNETGYNPAYTIAALLTYVKAGFIPRAPALQAASDSVAPSTGWIGALQGVGSGADKSRLLLLGVGA